MVNALWITKMCAYKNSSLSIETSKVILKIKIERQRILLKKYKKSISETNIKNKSELNTVLLEEARMAQKFWKKFNELLPGNLEFPSRKPRNKDTVNQFLDIGYHHLTNKVCEVLDRYNIPKELGLFHVARNSDSAPLAYDLVEMFRSDIVESEVLRFLRMKKKKLETTNGQIPHFIHEVNKKFEKKYYLNDFKRCHTYKYYMEVQILKFVKAVNHKEIFRPIKLPTRHESRCS